MTIADKIKEKREQQGLTQQELGELCGTGKQTIYKYETGIITNIPLDRLELIAEALHTTPGYLMGWEDEARQEEQELIELREEMRRKPGLRTLFSLTKHATNEDLEAVAAMLRHFKGEDDE